MLKELKNIKKISFNKSEIKKLPQLPGVYLYWNDRRNVIYVGKAINIKKRVESYLQKNLGSKTEAMINETTFISTITVGSEIEALLLEANLIKK